MSARSEKMLVLRLDRAQIAAQEAAAFFDTLRCKKTDLVASCNAIAALRRSLDLARDVHDLALRLDSERREARKAGKR